MPRDLFEKTPQKTAPKDLLGEYAVEPAMATPITVPAEPPLWKGIAKSADDVVRSIASGLTFGFADELAAAGNAAFTDDTYEQAHEKEMARDADIHPGIAIPGQLAGGIVTGGLGAGKVLASQAVKNAPTLARMLMYPALGATEGAIAGAGYANPDERGKGAAVGGGTGAVLGSVLPGAIWAGGKAIQKVKDLRAPATDAAMSRLYKALVRDGMSPDQAAAKLREMGPDAAMVDVGRNVSGLAEATATRPGKALDSAVDFFDARKEGQLGRILQTLDDSAPPARSVVATESTPDFQNALKIHIPMTRELKKYLARPSVRAGWKNAQNLAAEGDETLPALDDVLNNKEIVGVETRVMHWLKKGMDDILEKKRDGVSGKLESEYGTNMLKAVENSRAQFRGHVKDLNKDYAKQLDRIAAAKKVEEAARLGDDFYNRKMTPAAIQTLTRRLNPEQRAAYQRGVLRQIEAKITPRGEVNYDVSNDVRRLRPKLEAVFGQKRADEIADKMLQEKRFTETGNRVLGNSRTAARQEAIKDFDDGTIGTAVDVVTGTPTSTITSGMKALGNMLRRPSEEISDELADVLYSTDRNAQLRYIAELLKREEMGRAASGKTRAVSSAAIGASSQPIQPREPLRIEVRPQ